jgi:hypothetical protein
MDPVLKQWARITSRVGISSFPEFLRHHLNSQREYIRQKQLFKTIKREVTTLKDVFKLLDKLEKDAAWFEALNDHSNEFWLDYQGAREHVRVLNLFGVSQFTPFVLAAKDCLHDASQLIDVLRYCAVLSIRFNGVGKRSTHVLEEIYNRAALELRSGRAKRMSDLRETLAQIYIPDDEFVADFSTLRMKARGISGKRLRYLLAKLEKQKSGSDISDDTMQATIEHILPENPSDTGWQNFSDEAHDRASERLGNYTLLERSLNSSDAGNASFESKQDAYRRSTYQLTQDLTNFTEWTEDTIAQRQSAMAKMAKSIWSIPL